MCACLNLVRGCSCQRPSDPCRGRIESNKYKCQGLHSITVNCQPIIMAHCSPERNADLAAKDNTRNYHSKDAKQK